MAATSAHRKASSSFRSLAGTTTARHDYRTRVLMRTGMAGVMKTMGRSSSVTDLFAKHHSWEYTLSVLRGSLWRSKLHPTSCGTLRHCQYCAACCSLFFYVGSWIACSRRCGGQRAHCLAHNFGRRRAPRPCLSRSSDRQLALETAGRIAYVFFGVYLIAHPSLGVVALTLVLASLFLVEGIFDIALFFQMRAVGGSSWILVDGIVTLLLGLMIYLQWPSSSNWAIGTLVGVSLIISGITRVMLSLAVGKIAAGLASSSSGTAA